ncbi:MAG: hypothetical protein ACFFCI_10935 [Promethearchaeota archaeon]
MSLYYTNRIGYLMEDISESNFDFKEFIDLFIDALAEGKIPLYKKSKVISIQLEIQCPDFEVINNLYELGKIKSHETEAAIDKAKDMVKYAISNLMYKLNYTIDRYSLFKNNVKIQRLEYLVRNTGAHDSDRIDIISMEFNTKFLELRDIVAFVKMWALQEFTFAEQVIGRVYIQNQDEKKNGEPLIKHHLERRNFQELHDHLSTEDNEYLQHPAFYKILKAYMFPEKFQGSAEITLDIAKEDNVPQKRRTVSIKGSKMRFHELISKTTPYESYKEVIQENDIVGIYLSVRGTNNNILYLLIDIDVTTLLSSMFSAQVIWELTVNIATEINNVAIQLGLPPFKMMFSGARGIHLVYAMDYDAITDIEHHVNLPELSQNTLLPGITSLKKEKISSLNDKFKFIKTLLQSLLLYTVYKGKIQIPFEIKNKLKMVHPYQLFRLAVDSKNCLATLLDCSSVSKGVFRLFSPHPMSKLVSIPISDLEKNGICNEYLDYRVLTEEAKIERVIERFSNEELDLFLQMPHCITREHIQILLRPDKLYPSFAIILRFGTTYAIKRSPYSFQFWHRFYETRGFYGYLQTAILNDKEEDPKAIMVSLRKMAIQLNISNRSEVVDLLQQYFYYKTISIPVLLNYLTTLYYFDFFFSIKTTSYIQENQDNLVELFKNKWEFSNFLNQTEHMFSIAVHIVIKCAILNDYRDLPHPQRKCLETLERETSVLLQLAHHSLDETRNSTHSDEKEERLITTIYYISKMYFTSVKFLQAFTTHEGRE